MCGIVGVAGPPDAVTRVLGGLVALESRGYDSAGLAFVPKGETRARLIKDAVSPSVLRQRHLDSVSSEQNLPCALAIGHNRWATQGAVAARNAHPHVSTSGRFVLVHNGDITNADALRQELVEKGVQFLSETDSEVIVQMLDQEGLLAEDSFDPLVRIQKTLQRLEGAYAVVIMVPELGHLYAVSRGQPLLIGETSQGAYIASQAEAFPPEVQTFLTLQDGAIAAFEATGARLPGLWQWIDGRLCGPEAVTRNTVLSHDDERPPIGTGQSTLYEILQTPHVVRRLVPFGGTDDLKKAAAIMRQAMMRGNRCWLVACGSAHHACLYGARVLGNLPGVMVRTASEFVAKESREGDVLIAVSQSGETGDVLDALRDFRRHAPKSPTIGIINRDPSTLGGLVDRVILLGAGMEDGVAATKSFVAQCVVFAFADWLMRDGGADSSGADIISIPEFAREMGLFLDDVGDRMEEYAERFFARGRDSRSFCLGQGLAHPMALEAALKIQEVTCTWSLGLPTAALKHGPMALLDDDGVSVLLFVTDGEDRERVFAAMREIRARAARAFILLVGTKEALAGAPHDAYTEHCSISHIVTPIPAALLPLLQVQVAQLLAVYGARRLGLDPDRPRHIAKTVTTH